MLLPAKSSFLCLFVALTTSCGGASSAPVQFGVGLPVASATPKVHTLERQMFERVNRDRAKNQLPKLTFDPKLSDIARSHSADMLQNRFFEHESPRYGLLEARLSRAGYLFRSARENLAEAPTVDEAEDGLLKSPHHYENLMATNITHVGIGIVSGGVQDPRNLTVTQIFATPGKVESDVEATRAIVEAVAGARRKSGLPAVSRHQKLDAMAAEHLATLASEPSTSILKAVGQKVTARLAQSPILGVSGVAIGAQVVVDSSEYTVDSLFLTAKARYYGLAVDHGPSGTAPRLRVFVIVGIGQ